jgi:hypothetical protein
LYKKFKEDWVKFKDVNPQYKVLFAYPGNHSINRGLIKQEYDMVYDDIIEESSGSIEKHKRTIKYANDNYEYDFILRTNLSSVIDINSLDIYLNNLENKTNRFIANFNFNHEDINFPFGVMVLMSKDVADLLINANTTDKYPEDVEIGRYLIYEQNIQPENIDPKYFIFAVDYDETMYEQMSADIENAANNNAIIYRIKNSKGNRYDIDTTYRRKLFSKIYPEIKYE